MEGGGNGFDADAFSYVDALAVCYGYSKCSHVALRIAAADSFLLLASGKMALPCNLIVAYAELSRDGAKHETQHSSVISRGGYDPRELIVDAQRRGRDVYVSSFLEVPGSEPAFDHVLSVPLLEENLPNVGEYRGLPGGSSVTRVPPRRHRTVRACSLFKLGTSKCMCEQTALPSAFRSPGGFFLRWSQKLGFADGCGLSRHEAALLRGPTDIVSRCLGLRVNQTKDMLSFFFRVGLNIARRAFDSVEVGNILAAVVSPQSFASCGLLSQLPCCCYLDNQRLDEEVAAQYVEVSGTALACLDALGWDAPPRVAAHEVLLVRAMAADSSIPHMPLDVILLAYSLGRRCAGNMVHAERVLKLKEGKYTFRLQNDHALRAVLYPRMPSVWRGHAVWQDTVPRGSVRHTTIVSVPMGSDCARWWRVMRGPDLPFVLVSGPDGGGYSCTLPIRR